jgi:hypothetical protein
LLHISEERAEQREYVEMREVLVSRLSFERCRPTWNQYIIDDE